MKTEKLTINLISKHSQEEVVALARQVEQLASSYLFSMEKIMHDFAELQRLNFSVSEFKYLQFALVVGVLKENPGIWFDEQKEKTIGDAIALTLDVAVRISPDIVLDRFRASGIQVLQSGRFAYLSDRLTESELADRAVDTALWEQELREFAKVTGLSL